MKLKAKDMNIATGDIRIVLLNHKDAHKIDLHPEDRIVLRKNGKIATAVVDIAESCKTVPLGSIGLFEEVLKDLGAKTGDFIDVTFQSKPESIRHIKKKLDGHELNEIEINSIVKDIVDNKLTDIEMTYFVSGIYTKGMTQKETVALTKAMINSGSKLEINKKQVFALHSIGGVSGNRTTMVVVPILIEAGLIVPKTASRAITSSSGTADTMEVLCGVSWPISKLKEFIERVGGFIVWGGAVKLAPADDRIINIEHPLSIDPEQQMIASIMSKQGSISATHVLIEIPFGFGAKIDTKKKAEHLGKEFKKIGKELGMIVQFILEDGSQPIGNGIGPGLECRDVIWALSNNVNAPKDLIERSLEVAGKALEMTGHKNGRKLAAEILYSGRAYKKFFEIVVAQGGKIVKPDQLPLGKYSYTVKAPADCTVEHIDNKSISRMARIAGAPKDLGAGVFIHKHVGEKADKNEPLFTVYAETKQKLDYIVSNLEHLDGFTVR